jgi:F-type H+-transporting ATPase subunit gamma
MTTLREIRRRIRSIEKIRQITKAMKTVSLVKLMRSQAQVVRLKPYSQKLQSIIADLAAHAEEKFHPLLAERPVVKRLLVVVLTSDQGLTGAFNHNITSATVNYLKENRDKAIELWTIGKRGRDFMRRQGHPAARDFIGFYRMMRPNDAEILGKEMQDRFLAGALDGVVLIYNEFKSISQQQVVKEQILPIRVGMGEAQFPEYLYEPDPITVLDRILPMYLTTELWRAFLESVTAEHAARMNAMDMASRNATDMITDFTLFYNKARQAAITKDLSEITTAAEAFQMV